MEMSRKKFGTVLAITIILSVCLTSAWWSLDAWSFSHRDPTMRANVYVTIQQRFGTRQINQRVGNLITDIGERYVRNILGWDNVTNNNATQWISLSNDATPLDTWTELPGEVDNTNGFGRAANDTCVAWMNGTDYAYNVTNTFQGTGTQQLQCAGLNWNGTLQSDENLFAAVSFTQTTFENGDNLTITWVITWDGND